jgi:hypothetical protein
MPVVAQSAQEPWKLRLEERIVLRTNPELAHQRIRMGGHVHTSGTAPSTEASAWADGFDGKTHPELFLPHEVFDELVKLAFTGDPRMGQVVRNGFAREVERHGLPADFWNRLQSVSTVYVADVWALRDLGAGVQHQNGGPRRRAEEALTLKQMDACRSRSDSLAAARNEFGRERFDRFLYEVIAVNMFSASDRIAEPELLLKIERGCR